MEELVVGDWVRIRLVHWVRKLMKAELQVVADCNSHYWTEHCALAVSNTVDYDLPAVCQDIARSGSHSWNSAAVRHVYSVNRQNYLHYLLCDSSHKHHTHYAVDLGVYTPIPVRYSKQYPQISLGSC